MRSLIGFWLAVAVLAGVVAWSAPAECSNCGQACTSSYDCFSGCDCMYPEHDDNHRRGICGPTGGY